MGVSAVDVEGQREIQNGQRGSATVGVLRKARRTVGEIPTNEGEGEREKERDRGREPESTQ